MKVLYILFVKLYSAGIALSSLFSTKAKLRYTGVKTTFKKLKEANLSDSVWFHCASLGEFEQGRSLIEALKSNDPECKIVLSFFSPSGCEIRKNYEFADVVFYLPSDSPRNAQKIIELLQPKKVFFIKYEFWHFYLKTIKENNIPVYLVSGIFRSDQIFFKTYGLFFRNILHNFKHLFVQNISSKDLLNGVNIKNVSVTGDTRFDRVYDIAQTKKTFPLINKFVTDSLVLIAGSTWKADEDMLSAFINITELPLKFIIAPHEIKEDHIQNLEHSIQKKTLRYSKLSEKGPFNADVLIIDNIGMLASLYAYGHIAYIGGGFGAGIHNTLEAAVFGIPVIFGPKYQKFDEAKELVKREAGFSVKGKEELFSILNKLISNSEYRISTGKKSELYVNENIGATQMILKKLSK